MKKLFFLFVCAAIAAACSSEMEVPSPVNPDDEMVEVSFNLGGDYVSVEEMPMTRAFAENAKTLYAVQVNREYKDDYHGDLKPYVVKEPYAHGLFSDLRNARISLPKNGNEYRVEVLVINEREDVYESDNGVYNHLPCYNRCYWLDGYSYSLSLKIDNKFTVDTEGGLSLDNFAFDGRLKRIDRYYGSKLFKPNNREEVMIDMERYAFSMTYNIIPPVDGVIKVSAPNCGDRLLCQVTAGESEKNEQVIYDTRLKPQNKDDAYDLDIKVEWIREKEENYSEIKTISVKRKTNYNININMNNRDNETSFGLNMGDEGFAEIDIDIN